MNYLGIDIGGTGVKAGLFSDTGELLGFSRSAITSAKPKPGYAEIEVEALKRGAITAVHEAVDGRDVAALSISSQGQTFSSFDQAGNPLHPMILWYDERGSEIDTVFRPLSSAAKCAWYDQHDPLMAEHRHILMLLPDYLTWLLTGNRVTDPNTAHSSGLEKNGNYDDALLKAADLRMEAVSEIKETGSLGGLVSPQAEAEWGLPAGMPLIVGTNDQYAGALGAGNAASGIVTETTGTCLALVTLCDALPDPLPLGIFGGDFPLPDTSFLLAFSKNTGLNLDDCRERICACRPHAELETAASKIAPGCDGLNVVPPVSRGGILHREPRVVFNGATDSHTPAHFYRAVLESAAYDLKYHLDNLAKNGYPADTLRSIGGGAASDLWLQIKADVLNMPVERPAVSEAAVFGAAMIAMAGSGQYADLAECSRRLYRPETVFMPEQAEAYELLFAQYLTGISFSG